MREHCDVVIVGGRCAGSALAVLLARQGLQVIVLEQVHHPKATLSSHALQTDAVSFLERLKVIDKVVQTGAPFMTRVDTRMEDFRTITDYPLQPGDVGGALSIRREVLDPILAEAAVDAGADFRMGARVVNLLTDEHGRVEGVRAVRAGKKMEIYGKLVIGADGRDSTVARLVGARKYNVTHNERWYYWTYFTGAQWSEPTFIFHRWGDRHVFAGPCDDGLYIVGVSPEVHEREAFRRNLRESVMQHARSCEPVAAAIDQAQQTGKIFGITKFSGYFREPSGPGWVLVGDSGHFKDPAVGRGIADAFRQADTLAAVLRQRIHGNAKDLDRAIARWGRQRDRKYADYYWMATDVGCAGPVPGLFAKVLEELARNGEINRYLELFSHRRSPTQLMSPRYLGPAMGRMLWRADSSRIDVVRNFAILLRQEAGRRWASWQPKWAPSAAASVNAKGSPQVKVGAR
ncbi:NAD(P)/FAD-dependent oxidoreductase [Nocardia yamanashiensis]|uniref:NAD(P)/FAD-dependent oxidoreductase n=1 Tax=Nocardia yamanashiensis TaxID=209247 RepID=UPI001E4C3D47|nr:NAD(P)/FAD-dependent oxidoreductase [Nocardia yamanashiensis]UGT45587.1 NAD(P)/FAD-dependent oxidoreductase [Nocardia yamanashiensis]